MTDLRPLALVACRVLRAEPRPEVLAALLEAWERIRPGRRTAQLTEEVVENLIRSGRSVAEIARQFGVSRQSVYRRLSGSRMYRPRCSTNA